MPNSDTKTDQDGTKNEDDKEVDNPLKEEKVEPATKNNNNEPGKDTGDDKKESEDEEEDEEDEEDESINVEPLATTRSRRSNAGAKMSQMIQAEEDEFYSNLYGGFNEEDDDIDFDEEKEAEEGDVEDDYSVDSDFSIDETDEIAPEHRDESEEPKKKSTRVYREPKPKQSIASRAESSFSSSKPASLGPTPSKVAKLEKKSREHIEPKSRFVRESTKEKSEQTLKRMQKTTRRKKRSNSYKAMTQEEILAEAKITEEENLRSLERYQKLELEKLKKIRTVKKTVQKPYTTFTSTTMPVIGTEERYTRNFLTFIS